MIYLAESGSTKSDGLFLNHQGEEIARVETQGINPLFANAASIKQALAENEKIKQDAPQVEQVYFYGTSCSSPARKNLVKEGLQQVFTNAKIYVEHDLLAAAYATYTGEPAITGILGTGSSCIYFDGKKSQTVISGLGYVLGDEGSATHLGKKLLRAYLYRQMPPQALDDFTEEFGYSRKYVINRLYNEPAPHLFLANLTPFAQKHLDQPFFYELVFGSFKEFIETQILNFEEAPEVPIHFAGSVAHYFEEVLKDVLRFFDLRPGQITRRPLEGLRQYHQKYILK